MSDEKPIIYLSKRCSHCINLINILKERNDLNGNYTLVVIDEEPFPEYVKAVPCMVLGQEMFNAGELFAMLEESSNSNSQSSQSSQSGSKECSINQLPFMVEKPLSTSMDGVDEVIDLVKKNNLFVRVGYTRRNSHEARALKDKIHNNKIGDVKLAYVNSSQEFPKYRPDYQSKETV